MVAKLQLCVPGLVTKSDFLNLATDPLGFPMIQTLHCVPGLSTTTR